MPIQYTDELREVALAALDGAFNGDFYYGDVLDAVQAVLAALPDVPQWMPIDEAPKDGTEILVKWKHSDTFLVVGYDETCTTHGEDYVWATLDGLNYHKDAFTHWMPLPAPPKEGE